MDKTQVMIRYIVNNQLRILATFELAIREDFSIFSDDVLDQALNRQVLVQRLEQLLLPAPALSSTVQKNILVLSVLI